MKVLRKVARNALLVSLLASCTTVWRNSGTSSGGVAAQEFQLDDVFVPVNLNGLEANVSATEIFCRGLSPRDLSLSWDAALDEGSQEEIFNLLASIDYFKLDCTLNYAYSSEYLNGNGTILVRTANDTLDVNMDIVSSPTIATTTTVHNCAIKIAVSQVEFFNDELLKPVFESVLSEPGGVVDDVGDGICRLLEDPSKLADILTGLAFEGSEEADQEDGEEEMDLSVLVKSLASANPQSREDAFLQELATTNTTVPQLINFQESTTWPAWGVVGLMNWLGQSLGQTTSQEREDGTEEHDLSINFFLRSILPSPATDGVEVTLDLTTPISLTGSVDGATAEGPSVFIVDQVQLLGFDSFTRFANVTYLGQHTFQLDLAMEEVRLRVLGNLQDGAEESVSMEFIVHNIDLTVALLLAIDEVALGSIPFGVLFQGEDELSGVLDCVMASLVKLELADSMIRSLKVAEDPSSGDLPRIRDAGIEFGLLNILTDILPALLLPEAEAQCAPDAFPVNSESPFLDFRELLLEPAVARSYGGLGTQPYGSLLSGIKTYLTNEVLGTDPVTGALLVNANFIAPFTEAQSGTAGILDFQDISNVTSLSIEYIGTLAESRMDTSIKRIRIEGIDSFEKPAAFLDPVIGEAFALNNMIAVQSLKLTAIFRSSIYIDFVGQIPVNDMALMVDLSELAVLINIFAVVDEGSFFGFPLRDLFDSNCWLATILPPKEGMEDPTLSLQDIEATAERFELSARCHNCADSGFEPVSGVFPATGLNTMVDKVLFPLRGSDSSLQHEINQAILGAPKQCRHHPDYDPNIEESHIGENLDLSQSDTALKEFTPMLIAAIALMVGLAVVTAAFFCGAQCVLVRRHRSWLLSLEADRIAALCVAQENEKKRQSLVNSTAGAMFIGEAVPLRIRWLVPLMMLASTGLFCAGFFVLGHDVFISISVAGGELFGLSTQNNLFQICRDLWEPGSEFLAIMVFLAGLTIPIVKNACTIALWYLPTSLVSTSKRLLFMQTLCELGKFDIAIILVVIIVSVMYRVQIMSDVLSFTGEQLFELNLILYPMYGIHIWILGQILSQFSSQVFLVYHGVSVSASERKVDGSELAVTSSDMEEENMKGSQLRKVNSADSTEEDSDLGNHPTEGEVPLREEFASRSALNDRIFSHSSASSTPEYFHVRSGVNMVVGLIGVASIGLIVAGCVLPVLSVEATGFFADLIELNPGPSVHTFDLSLITIMERLVKDASFLGDALTTVGIWFLCIFIILTVMVMPILSVCGLLVQWFYPLTALNRKVVAFLTSRAHSWQYTETFLICAVAVVATLQLSELLELIVGRFCEGIGAILVSAIQTGLMPVDEEFHCYVVTPYIEIGSLLLIPGVFCVAMLHNFVMSAAKQVESADSMLRTSKSASKRIVATSSFTDEDTQERIEQIDSPKIEFSDRFRWFVCPVEKDLLHL